MSATLLDRCVEVAASVDLERLLFVLSAGLPPHDLFEVDARTA